MEWRDQGILLSERRHGETAAIIEIFTEAHGRHAGVVRGGASRKIAPILQPGAQLDLTWRARLEDHIGTFTVEPVRSRAVAAMSSRLALAGLNAVTSLIGFALPEREPHPALYSQTERLLDLLRGLVRDMGLSAVIVTHDLAVVRLLADRLMVMKDGYVVETGLTDQVLDDPQHAYTQLLVSSVLQV